MVHKYIQIEQGRKKMPLYPDCKEITSILKGFNLNIILIPDAYAEAATVT